MANDEIRYLKKRINWAEQRAYRAESDQTYLLEQAYIQDLKARIVEVSAGAPK